MKFDGIFLRSPAEALDKSVVEAEEMTNATPESPTSGFMTWSFYDFATDIRLTIHDWVVATQIFFIFTPIVWGDDPI